MCLGLQRLRGDVVKYGFYSRDYGIDFVLLGLQSCLEVLELHLRVGADHYKHHSDVLNTLHILKDELLSQEHTLELLSNLFLCCMRFIPLLAR